MMLLGYNSGMKSLFLYKVIRIISLAISLLFSVNTVVLIFMGSFTVGTAIMAAVALFSILLFMFTDFFIKITKKGVGKFIKYAALILSFTFILLGFFIISQSKTYTDYKEEAVIVLGGGIKEDGTPSPQLKYRLNECMKYLNENPSVPIVVSGGYSQSEVLSEAESMAYYLIANGIPKEQIFPDSNSYSTKENFENSKDILLSMGVNIQHVVFVTNDYHIFRSKNYAVKTGFKNIHFISAPTDRATFIPSLIRETCAVISMPFG
jgi:uncharacterized SAM-binding protein YcdF (DUF218 family)